MSDQLDSRIELPVHDKYGRTIHLGDTVYLSALDKGVVVNSITFYSNGNISIHFNDGHGCGDYSPSMVSVVRPDSWPRIWDDYSNLVRDKLLNGGAVYDLLVRAQNLSDDESDE